jgi:hypothetical protein
MNATTRLSRGGHAVAAARRESASPSRNVTNTAATASTLLTGESEGTTIWGTSTSRVHERNLRKSGCAAGAAVARRPHSGCPSLPILLHPPNEPQPPTQEAGAVSWLAIRQSGALSCRFAGAVPSSRPLVISDSGVARLTLPLGGSFRRSVDSMAVARPRPVTPTSLLDRDFYDGSCAFGASRRSRTRTRAMRFSRTDSTRRSYAFALIVSPRLGSRPRLLKRRPPIEL